MAVSRRYARLRLRSLVACLALSLAAACEPMFPCGSMLPTYRDCRPFGALEDLFSDDPEEDAAPKPQELIICRDSERNYKGYYADACPDGEEKVG